MFKISSMSMSGNVRIAIINHPPGHHKWVVIINHQKWAVYYCYTRINGLSGNEQISKQDEDRAIEDQVH